MTPAHPKSSRCWPSRPAAAAWIAAGLMLAGCADTVITRSSNDMQIEPGILGSFRYAAGGRDMRVRVLSNPYPIADADFDAIVTDAMQGHNHGPATTFAAMPTERTREGYEIVVWFGPRGGVNRQKMCAMERSDDKVTGEWLHAIAVFCVPGRAMSWSSGTIRHVEDPRDPLFDRMMARVTRALIPPRDNERERGKLF